MINNQSHCNKVSDINKKLLTVKLLTLSGDLCELVWWIWWIII